MNVVVANRSRGRTHQLEARRSAGNLHEKLRSFPQKTSLIRDTSMDMLFGK
jgi:hypothetical protein